MKSNLIVIGTRPELIKFIPIIMELRKRNWEDHFKIVCTGQHNELIQDLILQFDIKPDFVLSDQTPNTTVAQSLSEIMAGLQAYVTLHLSKINYIIGQGDTTSCLAAAMVASLNQLPFAHVEAGLRTYDLVNPFPEEYFRQIISISSTIHFTPTLKATKNLLSENVDSANIIQTGNTIVDFVELWKSSDIKVETSAIDPFISKDNNVIITCHRRENQMYFDTLIDLIIDLAKSQKNLNFIWISHKNPFVQDKLKSKSLAEIPNISVIEPLTIFEMFRLYQSCKVIITDSGGIQEEAVSFDLPTLVIREQTERDEAIEVGNSKLVPLSKKDIKTAFDHFITLENTVDVNPFGDGKAALRILDYFEDLIEK